MTTQPGIFYPRLAYITNISNAFLAVINFSADHTYTLGEVLSLRVPAQFGMTELNNQEVRVVMTSSNTVTIDVDTRSFVPFVPVSGFTQFPCMAVPAASGQVPGAFIPTMNLLDAFDVLPPG